MKPCYETRTEPAPRRLLPLALLLGLSATVAADAPSGGAAHQAVGGGAGGVATLSNGGTRTNASSRTFKTGFAAVDARAVLEKLAAIEITRWQYKGSEEGTHMGPMAEDFKAAFDLAGDGKSIATVDADGVALAAIQGLNEKLERENAALRARLDAIETMLRNARVAKAPVQWQESALAAGGGG